jgi:2-dehydropantoate 2-reductase
MSDDPIAVAVVGGGAIGTVLAAAAAERGHRVIVCTRQPTSGRTLVRRGESTPVAVSFTHDPSTAQPVAWVLLTTKAHHVAAARPWLQTLVDSETRLVVCQNGIDHLERIGPVTDGAEVLPAVVGIMAEQTSPGVVVHSGGDRLTVGESPAGAALRDAFAGSLIEVHLVDDIVRAAWCKLLGNLAAGPVTTLLGQPMSVLRRPELLGLVTSILTEAVTVGIAAGVDLRNDDVDTTIELLHTLPAHVRSSMEVDRANCRPLEIEEITGALVARADGLGIEAPVNRTLLALVRAINSEGSTS